MKFQLGKKYLQSGSPEIVWDSEFTPPQRSALPQTNSSPSRQVDALQS